MGAMHLLIHFKVKLFSLEELTVVKLLGRLRYDYLGT